MSSSWISLYKRIFSIAPNISVQKLLFCDSTCLPEWTSVVLLRYTQNSFIHRVGFCSSAVSLAEKNSTPLLLQVQNCQFHGVTPRTATAKNNKNNNSNNSNNNNNKNNNNKNNNNNNNNNNIQARLQLFLEGHAGEKILQHFYSSIEQQLLLEKFCNCMYM